MSTGDYFFHTKGFKHEYKGRALDQPDCKWRDVRVGVSLSGGGYRAALLHAGVLRTLDEIGIPVNAVSSVSGGSITGAFYAVGGNPSDLLVAMNERRFNLKRDLIDLQNLVPMVLSSRIPFTDAKLLPIEHYGRTQVQANLVDNMLLGQATFKDTGHGTLPQLMICTTDLSDASMVGITANGCVRKFINPSIKRMTASLIKAPELDIAATLPYDNLIPGNERLATYVAASGAFPGAFNALRIEHDIEVPGQGKQKKIFYLADGGIIDNLGVELMKGANFLAKHSDAFTNTPEAKIDLSAWHLDMIIVSDAGALFEAMNPPKTGLQEIARAIDIVYATGGPQQGQKANASDYPEPIVLLTPCHLSPPIMRGLDPKLKSPFSLDSPDFASGFVFDDINRYVKYTASDPGMRQLFFKKLDESSLNLIIDTLPPADQQQARQLKSQIPQIGTLETGINSIYDIEKVDFICSQHPSDPERMLYCLIKQDISRCLKAFVSASTLDDNLDPETAKSIYRLGQYLVLLNKSDIIRNLEEIQSKKQ